MRHISCIDNFDNLKALVRQELRELGIKVPKNKKSKKQTGRNPHSQNKEKDTGSHDGRVFGNYLCHVSCIYQENCGYVPRFLVDAAKLINENIEQEGLFRKSGAVSRQKELQQQIEDGKGVSDANVFDVTSLIKQFFRMLPEPLFTSIYHDTFIKCYQLENSKEATNAVLMLCLLLPGEHLSTLRYMMRLLSNIANCSEKNKMDKTNLAVVLAPNMMHINSKSEMMKSSEEKLLQVQTSVVELLIQQAEEIGMVSDSLYDRAQLMTEVFGTDDELDASEETLEESKDCKKKEKKRKRSGSFQGLVSSIAQSISKWRRSTDGKAGNLSTASNVSQVSGYSNVSQASVNPNQSCVSNEVPQMPDMTLATPVVMRKRKASGDVLAFSATKKKAILQNLPQQATLANTPFTPATGMRKLDISEMKKAGTLNTPSISFSNNQVAFSATPSQAGKNTRKRLNLFSPSSARKGKKCSGSNISIQSTKKGKCKGLFRRLSGGRGDKPMPERPKSSQSQRQVGHRLASPAGSAKSSVRNRKSNTNKSHGGSSPESPIAAINNSTMSSPSMEQSVLSVGEEDMNNLNEGFILPEDDIDNSQISASSSDMDNSDLHVRMCLSDTAVNITSSGEESMYDRRHCSTSSDMDISKRCGSLRRGQPNSLKAGLLHGEKKNVAKLRRSFGLDKSEISDPIPIHVPPLPQCLNTLSLENGSRVDSGGNQQEEAMEKDVNNVTEGNVPGTCDNIQKELLGSEINSVEMEDKTLSNVTTDTAYDSDDSDTGFTAVSGNTVVLNSKPASLPCQKESGGNSHVLGDSSEFVNNNDTDPQPGLVSTMSSSNIHKNDSFDSLLKGQCTHDSPKDEMKKTLPRTVSTDSGKCSMFEESGIIENSVSVEESTEISSEFERASGEMMSINITNSAKDTSDLSRKPKKYISTSSLQLKMPTNVSRSHSLHVTDAKKTPNITPDLQISMETHKLLSRAGYLPGNKDVNTDGDIKVMGPPQPKIKHAEVNIPKHESIMELKTNLAGKVADSIKNIEGDVLERHNSPYRFANCVSRKRGVSPVRIPTIFAKHELDVAKIKEVVTINPKPPKGQAKLPISTQLLKPSEDAANKPPMPDKSKRPTRKPSIYYADEKSAHRLNLTAGCLETVIDNSPVIDNSLVGSTDGEEAMDTFECQQDKENQDIHTPENRISYTDAQLSDSLTETINDVCTPLSDRVEGKIPVKNETKNIKLPSKGPSIKQPMLAGNLKQRLMLRTPGGSTPHRIISMSQSPRSPIKPVKRLGSPGSPCRNTPRGKSHSTSPCKPHKNSLLSSIPHHLQDEINNIDC